MPELEGSDQEDQPNRQVASTPFETPVSKEEFDALTGRVNDLFDKLDQNRSNAEGDADRIAQLLRIIYIPNSPYQMVCMLCSLFKITCITKNKLTRD